MATRRGRKWTASGYDKALGRKRHLGTFDTKREAVAAEAEWKLRRKGTGSETCDRFAHRWTTDYPRPRESTNLHNAERVKRFAHVVRVVAVSGHWCAPHPPTVERNAPTDPHDASRRTGHQMDTRWSRPGRRQAQSGC